MRCCFGNNLIKTFALQNIKMNRLIFAQCKKLFSFNLRKYSTTRIYSEEYTVSTFTNLFVDCPFNVKIRPLDVHKYPNCDKLIINLYSNIPETKVNVTCTHDKSKFNIFGEFLDPLNKHTISCLIETPVKSDINVVTTERGTIDIRKINGDNILLKSESGDIISDSCQTKKINYSSTGGNITTLGTLHAAEIELETKNDSKIAVNHLQALKASIITENGDITVKSSYCDDTSFQTKCGKLILDNIHKNCSIIIMENGLLQMTGFDGTLNVDVMEGDIDIQASKLYDFSKITSRTRSTVLLRLSDWIQENTQIQTRCQQLKVSDEVKSIVKNKDVYAVLTPKNSNFTSELEINSCLSNVNIEGASWSDMLKLKGIKFSED